MKFADKLKLRMRRILLHCDGARAYRFACIPGVMTTNVKHKRPMPIYVARKLMYLPRDTALAHKRFVEKTTHERREVGKL